jgi:urease subunit beta
MIPGEILFGDGDVRSLPDREVWVLRVTNTGDRPIQVGSHFHLAEANPALDLDRGLARGCRLAIPAGTSERFEPGLARDVEVISYGGARIVAGFRGEVAGALDGPSPSAAGTGVGADDRQEPARG